MVAAHADAKQPGVLIFRKRLLPYSETFIANQGHALQRFRPLFVGLERHEQGVHYLDESSICVLEDHVAHVPMARLPMLLGLPPNREWLAAMRDHGPALIHVHFGNGVTAAAPIARALGIPMVVTWHGHDISRPLVGRFGRRVRQAIAVADHCVAVSGYVAGLLRQAGCPDHKLTVHHIGVHVPSSAPSPVPSNGRVLFVGRLVPKKGAGLLIEAMHRVQATVPGASLQIIGDGPLEQQLREQAARAEVAVEFLGRRPPNEVSRCMQEAMVVAAPSIRTARDFEGLGMVFVEAQALGRPVVGFRSGGIPDAIDDGRSGILVPEDDVGALASALAAVLGDSGRAQAMGDAGHRHARENHDLARQTRLLENVYADVGKVRLT